jgi:hypothetical protein
MPCNQDTCPDFTPNNRALKRYARGVRMSREIYPERNTKEVNVPDWYRDCVMYPYEDKCQSPNTLFQGGGSTTDPETGETTFNDEDQFDDVLTTGGSAGKFYKSLAGEDKWWQNRCPTYFRPGGSYGTGGLVDPFKTRYWEHAPSEISFEPNYSDTPFLYLFDTKEHLSGLPCHAICWTLSITPAGLNRGATYRYIPRKTAYYCDQTPDETYITYSTEDGKRTPAGVKDDDPVIHAVGTKDKGIVFRFGSGCGTSFADVSLRLIGLKSRKNFRRLGRWQKAFTRNRGTTDQWVFTEAGSLDQFDIIASKNPSHRYTTNVEVREPGTNALVATVNITIRPAKSKKDNDFNDAEIKVNNLTVGNVEADPDIEYDFLVPRESNPSDKRYIGKIRFTNVIAFDSGDCSQDIDSAYSLFVGGSGDDPADEDNYIAVDLTGGSRRGRGVGIVNKLGSGIWAPGNSGRTVVTRTFSFNGSQAIHGGNTGKKLKVKIRMEKFSDEDGDTDTRITILRVRKSGFGYVDGQVFPIRFTSNGTQYTVGYFRIGGVRGSGGVTSNPAPIEQGVPTGFRIAEPKMIGGVYAVNHPAWTSWANTYAVWCNDKEENLVGRSLEINHHDITLPAGTYQVELGFDDSGKLEIRDSEESTLYYESGNHVGGIPSSSPSTHTGSFTLSETKNVDIFIDVENAFNGDDWATNPAGWALVLKRNGNTVWTTRDAINGVNVGDAYRGMPLDETPYTNSWDGSAGQVFLSPQGNNIWKSKNTVVFKDYSFPGGLKIRMKISAIFDSNTDKFKTAWQIDRVLSYGSGYGASGRTDFSDGGVVWGDQDVYYLYYPSTDTPKENRIGIALMISETQDTLLATNITENSLPNGATINGWTVSGVQIFDEEFNVAYASLDGNGNDFVKDTVYTASNGQVIKVLAGYGIKDRAALFGKYEFTEKEIQYGTAFVSEGVPFEPDLIKPQVVAIVKNGRVVGAQILKPGRGLSNRNIEPVRLVVDPPPTQFNHDLYNTLILQGEDVVKAVKRCTGTGKQAEVQAVISGGKLINVIIKNGGSGYSQDLPPKIGVPYIIRNQNITVQEKSTTAQSEPDNQILITKSPVYQNYNVNDYNKNQQVNYNEVIVTRAVSDISEMQLSNDKINYEYPENYMDPNWSEQFNTKNKKQYKFTKDVQKKYDELFSKSFVDSKDFLRKTSTPKNNIGGLNVNQEIRNELTSDQRSISQIPVGSTSEPVLPLTNLPSDIPGNLQNEFDQSSKIERDISSKTNSTQFGKDGNLDHYSTQFRDFLDAPITKPLPEDNFQNNSAILDDSVRLLRTSDSIANTIASSVGGSVSPNTSLTSLTRGFDQSILNKINENYTSDITKIPFPKTQEERQYQLNATTISTVKGGFYNLPCATSKVKYLLRNFCPDPRENTWINVRLGVRINPDQEDDIGRCTRCLLNSSTLVDRLNQIKSKDSDADIADAFCDVTYPLSSIFGNFIGYTPYKKSYLWSRSIYGPNDNAIVEGIRSWEISGNLEILHDLTQETRTFVDAVNKYGNPYNFLCGRSYGDLGENFKFDESSSSEEEDLEVPDQLADTSIDGV